MPKTTAPKTLRTMVLRALLGLLVLTALIAIFDIWTQIDEDGKVLMSSLVLTAAGVLALPGAAQLDRDRTSTTGIATMVLAPVAVVATLWLIWFEPHDADMLGRVVAGTWLWSLTVSLHALVMLAILPERAAWLKIAAPSLGHLAGVLATLAIFQWIMVEDWTRTLTITMYILAGLANVAVLIVHLIRRNERALAHQLILDEDGDDWRDRRSGRRYHVHEA